MSSALYIVLDMCLEDECGKNSFFVNIGTVTYRQLTMPKIFLMGNYYVMHTATLTIYVIFNSAFIDEVVV